MNKNLDTMRHSAAHVLASAIYKIFPDAKFGIGPDIENGFYYDFDLPRTLIPEDLPIIEKNMKELIKANLPFEKKEMKRDEAIAHFKKAKQQYKIELLEEMKDDKVTVYRCGDFVDLCKGPHVESTGEIKEFKLTHIAGAYWRGSEKNKMLQRIYGIAFETKENLKKHLKLLEEIKKRDHRKIGKELELFTFSEEIGKGLPLWLPKGNIIKEEIENWGKETEKAWGYVRVTTPHITKEKLYKISGHIPYYTDDLYAPFEIEDEKYYLKPMSCPHHHMIYKARKRSYKELPLRIAEYGTVYRYEDSGALYGLMRVRGITQNDAHIYCTKEQAKKEFLDVMKLHEFYYKKLGLEDYYIELALRDPANKKKYHGDEKMWEESEKMTREVLDKSKIPYIAKKGDAAHYGPKTDFIIKAVTGREFAISTNQLDLYMPKQFNLTYIDKDGKEKETVVIHRSPLGSHERFIGFLIEHFAGAFPLWLSPVQAAIIPVADAFNKYANKIKEEFEKNEIRVEINDKSESVGKRIRESEKQKIPYMIVVGEKEEKNDTITIRTRDKKEQKTLKVDKFIESAKIKINKKSLDL
ncbi:MAG: hypothetical protein ACD_63C00147G0002 [uncultured bacterium]|nr:MAG: hypothetical protein ACD_63C00147G0002 [uncultured bacterium]